MHSPEPTSTTDLSLRFVYLNLVWIPVNQAPDRLVSANSSKATSCGDFSAGQTAARPQPMHFHLLSEAKYPLFVSSVATDFSTAVPGFRSPFRPSPSTDRLRTGNVIAFTPEH
jgi:hypothetical protein